MSSVSLLPSTEKSSLKFLEEFTSALAPENMCSLKDPVISLSVHPRLTFDQHLALTTYTQERTPSILPSLNSHTTLSLVSCCGTLQCSVWSSQRTIKELCIHQDLSTGSSQGLHVQPSGSYPTLPPPHYHLNCCCSQSLSAPSPSLSFYSLLLP